MILNQKKSCPWKSKHYEIVILIFSIGITFSSIENVSAEEAILPSWIKNSAVWWGQDKISDQDFVYTLQYLIENKLLVIPKPEIIEPKCGPGLVLNGTDHCVIQDKSEIQGIFSDSIYEQQKIILSMIKTTTLWWGQDKISDEDFINVLQYLVENNIIILDDKKIKPQLKQQPKSTDLIEWPKIHKIDYFHVQGHKNTDLYQLQFKLIDIHQKHVRADGTVSIVIMDERNRILYLDGFSIRKSDYVESFNIFEEDEESEFVYSWEIKTSKIKHGFTSYGIAKIVFIDKFGNNFESEYDKISIP